MFGIIVDIDGTLLNGDKGVQRVINYINGESSVNDIFVVTGRPESEREKTVNALRKNGVKYKSLFMNPGSMGDSPEYKKRTAAMLQKRIHVILAIDNNDAAREAYSSLGIYTVHPNRLH